MSRWRLEEARYIYRNDPACKSIWEAYFLYPSLQALSAHRRAHRYYKRGWTGIARFLSQRARKKTGIEIHPGAQIGRYVFIDHGMGVVIGETAIIGDRVQIFHHVTLGGTGKEKDKKRHPTVEDDVLIGAGAFILGDVTLGKGAKIGANAVVLTDIPPGATAVGMPARILFTE